MKHLDYHLQENVALDCTKLATEPKEEFWQKFLKKVFEEDRNSATKMVMEEVEKGVSIKDIYLQVFQPTLYEIGRLWQINKISVAQEHYASAVIQFIMSRLYPQIFHGNKNGLTFVAACVSDELHEIGIRMIADLFELEGWNTWYLGANMPKEGVLKVLEERNVDVLAVSATMTFNVNSVIELIQDIRSSKKYNDMKIIVGGYPFNISEGLWKATGADGYSKNAEEALLVSQQLMKGVRIP